MNLGLWYHNADHQLDFVEIQQIIHNRTHNQFAGVNREGPSRNKAKH